MSEPINLKPCPFCGGEAILVKDIRDGNDGNIHYVKCQQCSANAGAYFQGNSLRNAVEAWNKRPEPLRGQYNNVVLKVDPNKNKLLIRFNCLLKPDVMEKIRQDFLEEYREGVVVVPPMCAIIIGDENTEFIFEKAGKINDQT